ncbi:MGH1-like glycoside hydrolase domain-containing protein [Gloeobacter violaceus]|uniref:Gll1168 protein n=1 Tax=Gloeobacter violaceus (strain ATCC 29082 / PCC 7421) TaxID=251221 RepID=Q7NLF6_GLOVI|nr:glucosidase [Gloeobacter violaceus]BAC89109.1 gll1168 [Gloeobacter violaceus PCC 7421]
MTREEERLLEAHSRLVHWRRWGPYLSERQWGTVREDYSENGTAWDYFPHDHARSRAYRWGEDGIAGVSDNHQYLCFALALWNGKDRILKERLFGLTGSEGNHGEDVKEYYFYLDNTPTHSYMKYLYKYPQAAFPYAELVEENRRRGRGQPEFELVNTGVFREDRYFDLTVEYAKVSQDDILIKIGATNRGPEEQPLHLLPTLWFRNTWSWDGSAKPVLRATGSGSATAVVEADHPTLGRRWLYCEGPEELIFTENETNHARLFGVPNVSPYVKDAFHAHVVGAEASAVNPDRVGTKAAAHYTRALRPGQTAVIRLRLCDRPDLAQPFGGEFETVLKTRIHEAEEFYARVCPDGTPEERNIQRQAFAGMLWNKQFYHFVVERWLKGDPSAPPPPASRRQGRNHEWPHLYNDDILSMPDKWEYPWFAAWDSAFHAIPLAMVDPDFAKGQLELLTREWYMHPNGQLPAYEWQFSDVNPPVHAWAALQVYEMEQQIYGRTDRSFLERVFQKLLLNFTWWVNRKDAEGKNVFQGGFLGLDNIGVFDRSARLPTGGHIDQSDGTSWMGMYCLNMLAIALELAKENLAYEDIASKFFEHFLYIADAMNHIGGEGIALWDEEDGFFYDVLHLDDRHLCLKVRSMVGLIPLYAIETLGPETLGRLPNFKRRLEWFVRNRPDLRRNVACMETAGIGAYRLFAIVSGDKLERVLRRLLDEDEFLSPHGIRAVSHYHKDHPYVFSSDGTEHRVDYEPAESTSGLFGGNSNWRGPVWFPVNYLIIEALGRFHRYLGDDFKVECPTGSGRYLSLAEVASELARRLVSIFKPDGRGRRPVFGSADLPFEADLLLFYEYFHGDNGAGIGASHQTGWTGLVAALIQRAARQHPPAPEAPRDPRAAAPEPLSTS